MWKVNESEIGVKLGSISLNFDENKNRENFRPFDLPTSFHCLQNSKKSTCSRFCFLSKQVQININ